MREIAIDIIKEELEKRGIEVKKVILFGSRARGNAKPDSDWDFLIVVDKDMTPREKREIASNIRLRLVYSEILADILIISEGQFNERLNDIGYITYYAVKEGIEL